MRKNIFSAISLASFLLAACTSSTGGGVSSSSSTTDVSSAMVETSTSSVEAIEPSSDAMEQKSSTMMHVSSAMEHSSSAASTVSDARVIQVDISNFAFAPTVISVKKGEKVKLKLVGVSGIHGFAAPGLGISVRVSAGETVLVDVPTGTAGSFNAFCNVPCGPGHRDMKATIVVS